MKFIIVKTKKGLHLILGSVSYCYELAHCKNTAWDGLNAVAGGDAYVNYDGQLVLNGSSKDYGTATQEQFEESLKNQVIARRVSQKMWEKFPFTHIKLGDKSDKLFPLLPADLDRYHVRWDDEKGWVPIPSTLD